MHDQGMFVIGTRPLAAQTLKPPQQIFRKTVSIDIQSPISSTDPKDQFFRDQHLAISFSSPPNSGRDNQLGIPDDEVVSQFLTDDNQSIISNQRQVRFSEPQERYESQFRRHSLGNPQKYRKQRSIPIPEKVQEDLIGESSQLSPYNKNNIRIKEKQYMNQSTNLLPENESHFNINAISLENSFCCKTISSNDKLELTNQMADELVNIVKNYLNDITYNERHFTFDEQEDESRNKFSIQQRVLKRALEHLNFKMNVTLCSPISRVSNTSPHFEDLQGNPKDMQLKIEELTDQNDLLKDRLEITDFKLLEQYDLIGQLNNKIAEYELKNKECEIIIEEKNKEILVANQQLNQFKSKLDEVNKLTQHQQLRISQLEQLVEKQKPQPVVQSINLNINNLLKPGKRHTNSFHDACSSPNGKKFIIINSSTNSSQQSPKNLQLSKNIKNSDETVYFGAMQNDKRQGYGNLKKGEQKLYMGFWKDDNYNGFGHLKNQQIEQGLIEINDLETVGNKWISYQGEFQEGLYNGYGIWTFSDNSRFHGLFRNGKASGRGTYYKGTNTITGIWDKNIKI